MLYPLMLGKSALQAINALGSANEIPEFRITALRLDLSRLFFYQIEQIVDITVSYVQSGDVPEKIKLNSVLATVNSPICPALSASSNTCSTVMFVGIPV